MITCPLVHIRMRSQTQPSCNWHRGGGGVCRATEEEDAFHFVSYVPFEGSVYELDGLSRGPLLLGPGTEACTDAAHPPSRRRTSAATAAPGRSGCAAAMRRVTDLRKWQRLLLGQASISKV